MHMSLLPQMRDDFSTMETWNLASCTCLSTYDVQGGENLTHIQTVNKTEFYNGIQYTHPLHITIMKVYSKLSSVLWYCSMNNNILTSEKHCGDYDRDCKQDAHWDALDKSPLISYHLLCFTLLMCKTVSKIPDLKLDTCLNEICW